MKKLDLTIEEGQALLSIAANFSLPEKLGSDQTYSIADRAIAGDEVRKLYREIRAWSPLMQTKERWLRFGPVDAWMEVKGESGKIGHRLMKNTLTVEINLDEDIISGIIWCLLAALHPSSGSIAGIAAQEDVLWPIASKLNRTRIIRETIGMTEKAKPVRWKSDDEFSIEKSSNKEEK